MPTVKKISTISFDVLPAEQAYAALRIQVKIDLAAPNEDPEIVHKLSDEFLNQYKADWKEIIQRIWEWSYCIKPHLPAPIKTVYEIYSGCISKAEKEPLKLSNNTYAFKGFVYEVNGFYTDDEFRLLILEDFDTDRRLFERLKAKFDADNNKEKTLSRPRIPESVRIEVWRRDSGKCAKCGSREKLEYDHIVPISRGGSNTVRNIELLCEKCNRSKSANIA